MASSLAAGKSGLLAQVSRQRAISQYRYCGPINHRSFASGRYNFPQLEWTDGKQRNINEEIDNVNKHNKDAAAFNEAITAEYEEAQEAIQNGKSAHLDRVNAIIAMYQKVFYKENQVFPKGHNREFNRKVKELGGLIDPQSQFRREDWAMRYKAKQWWNPIEWFQRAVKTYLPEEEPYASGFKNPIDAEEARNVLNIPEAALTEGRIRDHHRRWMLALHPDSGGNAFLAGKLNEAKFELEKTLAEQKTKGETKETKSKEQEEAEKNMSEAEKKRKMEEEVRAKRKKKAEVEEAAVSFGGVDEEPERTLHDPKNALWSNWINYDHIIGFKPYIMGPEPEVNFDHPDGWIKPEAKAIVSKKGLRRVPKGDRDGGENFETMQLKYWPMLYKRTIFKPVDPVEQDPNLILTKAEDDWWRNQGKSIKKLKEEEEKKEDYFLKKVVAEDKDEAEDPENIEAAIKFEMEEEEEEMKEAVEEESDEELFEIEEKILNNTQLRQKLDEDDAKFIRGTPSEKKAVLQEDFEEQERLHSIDLEAQNKGVFVEEYPDVAGVIRGEMPIPGQKPKVFKKYKDMMVSNIPPRRRKIAWGAPELVTPEEEQKNTVEDINYIIKENEEIWEPIYRNEKSPYFLEDLYLGQMQSLLRKQDMKLMWRTGSKAMADYYENLGKTPKDPEEESDFDIDRDFTMIGRIRALNRRKRREVELRSEITRRLLGQNIPDQERATFFKRREEIEQQFDMKRKMEEERRRLKTISEGMQPLPSDVFKAPHIEWEALRQERKWPEVAPEEWEYHHWFEGEPNDWEQRFVLDEDDMDELEALQNSEYEDWMEDFMEDYYPWEAQGQKKEFKKRKRRKKYKTTFRITPQILAEKKIWYRNKMSLKWDKWEDQFFYAAFPRDAFSVLMHDPRKIFFPQFPTQAEQEEQQMKEYFAILEKEDLEREERNAFISKNRQNLDKMLLEQKLNSAMPETRQKMTLSKSFFLSGKSWDDQAAESKEKRI
eukprot:TRINITY_DN803_c0_g2_i1.p1 TRINITY_DN803_c0_g2~~TRINITY_DN803_c0_g2_i1.p1  ORF type:complete len:993 (+),score=366.67 TRINITY_DN803_c0_g2_i1:542-3520(+)